MVTASEPRHASTLVRAGACVNTLPRRKRGAVVALNLSARVDRNARRVGSFKTWLALAPRRPEGALGSSTRISRACRAGSSTRGTGIRIKLALWAVGRTGSESARIALAVVLSLGARYAGGVHANFACGGLLLVAVGVGRADGASLAVHHDVALAADDLSAVRA
jgi:hypothetical protein